MGPTLRIVLTGLGGLALVGCAGGCAHDDSIGWSSRVVAAGGRGGVAGDSLGQMLLESRSGEARGADPFEASLADALEARDERLSGIASAPDDGP